MKLEEITREVVEKLSASCSDCSITNDIIDKQSFSCYPESPSFLMYRARLEGTSETDSGSLISLIEEWVRGGASVILTGVLMKVDAKCPVAISSLSEEECTKIPPPTPSTTLITVGSGGEQGSTSSTLIIGVVVVIALFIIIASIILLIIVVCVLRYHHSKHSLKNGVKLYVLTISAFHYTTV